MSVIQSQREFWHLVTCVTSGDHIISTTVGNTSDVATNKMLISFPFVTISIIYDACKYEDKK